MAQVTTIDAYKKKIQEAVSGKAKGGDTISLSLSYDTLAEAQLVLKQLRVIQKRLRFIKKEVNQDVKTIRHVYSQKIEKVGSGPGLSGFLIGKGRSSSLKASEKRNLRQRQDREIQPYQNVKLVIDELLMKIDAAKLDVEKYIAEKK